MIQEPPSKAWIPITAAIITGCCVVMAAIVAWGTPFAERMADNYFQDTPAPNVVVVTATHNISIEDEQLSTQSDPTFPPTNSPTATETVLAPSSTQASLSLGENLLRNGDFESSVQNSWETSATISTETGHNGTQAICSTQNNANNGLLWVGIGQNVSVKSGQTYLIEEWLKLENPANVTIQIWWYDSSNTKIDEDMPVGPLNNDSNWTEKSEEVIAPQGATSARITILHGVSGSTKIAGSTVCVDDIVFAPIY